MHVVHIMSTMGVFSTTEGYLEYHGNCSVLSSYPEYCGKINDACGKMFLSLFLR